MVNKTFNLIKENIRFKIIVLFISLILIIGITFLIRYFVLKNNKNEFDIIDNFIGYKLSFNRGVSYSSFSNSIVLTYFLQIFFAIAILIWFLLSKNKLVVTFLSLIFSGGLSNIIDRTIPDFSIIDNQWYYNTVVDYIYFSFTPTKAIFNFQDTIIVISWISLMVSLISIYILKNKKGHKNERDYI